MRSYLICTVIALAFALPAAAQAPPVPKAYPPNIWLASAVKKGANVVVRVSHLTPETGLREKDGQEVSEMVMMWGKPKEFELSKKVQAIRTDGKEVLKTLAKPVGVLCFVTSPENLAKPDAFYLALLREGSIALVFEAKDAYPEAPE